MLRFPLILFAALATAAPATAQDTERGQAELARSLEGRVAGEPVNCIQLSAIRSTRIINRTAILYDTGTRLYVNRPSGAEGLDDDDILLTKTASGDLCRLEIVTLLDRSSRMQRGSVGLGEFVPYSRPARGDSGH